MKIYIIKLLLLALFLAVFSGCAIGPVNGLLFTANRFPGEFNPKNDIEPVKEATGCIHEILGLVAYGSAGAGKIAIDAGIQRIASIDHSTLSVLNVVYMQYCTTVSGE